MKLYYKLMEIITLRIGMALLSYAHKDPYDPNYKIRHDVWEPRAYRFMNTSSRYMFKSLD